MKQKTYAGFPIQVVAEKTGLSQHVIRIWEKRYQTVIPGRTETKRRFYTEEDIEKLSLLKTLTDHKHRIHEIAQLNVEELRQLASSLPHKKPIENLAQANPLTQSASFQEMITGCVRAIENFDTQDFEMRLAEASIFFSPISIIENFTLPLLQVLAEGSSNGSLRMTHDHFAANILRPFLMSLNKTYYNFAQETPLIVCASPLRQLNECGPLLILAAATVLGVRPIYLGTNLPAEEIAAAIHRLKAKQVVISLVYPKKDPLLFAELQKLRQLLPSETQIIAAGSAVDSYLPVLERIQALRAENFKELVEIFSETDQFSYKVENKNRSSQILTA